MTAIVIDDEAHCRNVIVRILERYCPEIKIIAECKDGLEGATAILEYSPDIVFLDVEMPRMNGFQLLESLDNQKINFALIFTTAYDMFAIKAIKFSAFDYLLKPIDEKELVAAIQRLQNARQTKEQFQLLKNTYQQQDFSKIAIASVGEFRFIKLDEIIVIEADGNYSKFYLTNGETILASKTLGSFEEILIEKGFFRSHKQFIINLLHLKEYIGGDQNTIIMTNKLEAKLARTRREEFLQIFIKT